jgi:hypothetical protein
MMEHGGKSWAGHVKSELDRLELGYLWNEAANIAERKCKKIIKRRIEKCSFQESKRTIVGFPTCQLLTSMDVPFGMNQAIVGMGKGTRRMYSMTLLNCPGSLIIRRDDRKFCASCGEDLNEDSVFVHRIRTCTEFSGVRDRLSSDVDRVYDSKSILMAIEDGARLGPFGR